MKATPVRLPTKVSRELRDALCHTDHAFDRFLPREMQLVSAQHWTPLFVALRAAEWFDDLGVRTVVDIGSGVGKFCVAAALAGQCHFTGIEQRPRLVAEARSLARLFDVDDRVRFVEGSFGEIPTPAADAYYLYNPFGENIYGADEHIDDEVELGDARYLRDIAAVERLLEQAPAGTHLLTYNGFGGSVPASYQEVRVDRGLPNLLRMWTKTGAAEAA